MVVVGSGVGGNVVNESKKMGIWPMVYACMKVCFSGKEKK